MAPPVENELSDLVGVQRNPVIGGDAAAVGDVAAFDIENLGGAVAGREANADAGMEPPDAGLTATSP